MDPTTNCWMIQKYTQSISLFLPLFMPNTPSSLRTKASTYCMYYYFDYYFLFCLGPHVLILLTIIIHHFDLKSCEKPLAFKYEDAEEMIAACIKNGVQFMDGVMWTHHKRAAIMREHFQHLGDIRKVNGCFAVDDLPTDNIRLNKV